jgi:hypothetical protein
VESKDKELREAGRQKQNTHEHMQAQPPPRQINLETRRSPDTPGIIHPDILRAMRIHVSAHAVAVRWAWKSVEPSPALRDGAHLHGRRTLRECEDASIGSEESTQNGMG